MSNLSGFSLVRPNNVFLFLFVLIISATLSCTSPAIKSHKISENNQYINGIPYSLPMTILEIEMVIQPAKKIDEAKSTAAATAKKDSDAKAKASTAATAAAASAKEAANKAKAAAEKAEEAKRTAKPEELSKLTVAADLAKAEALRRDKEAEQAEIAAKAATKASADAKKTAQKAEDAAKGSGVGEGQIVGDKTADQFEILFKVTPKLVGNPSLRYIADWQLSPFASESLDFKVNPSTGLLETISITSEDQTGEFITTIAKSIIGFVKFGIGIPGISFDKSDQDMTNILKELSFLTGKYKYFIPLSEFNNDQNEDYCNPQTLCKALKKDLTGNFSLNVKVQQIKQENVWEGMESDQVDINTVEFQDGVKTRIMEPQLISLELQYNRARVVADHNDLFMAPDFSPIITLPVDKAAFVKVEHKLVFSNGVIQQVKSVKPSSALAIARVPLSIAESLVALPAEIIQLKFNIATNQKALIDAEEQLASARVLAKAEQERLKIKAEKDSIVEQSGLEKSLFEQQEQVGIREAQLTLSQTKIEILQKQIESYQKQVDELESQLEKLNQGLGN